MSTPNPAIEETRRWIESVVIGLNLCPFARAVFEGERIRYVVSEATHEQGLVDDLRVELRHLKNTPRAETETTLIIHPHVFADFLDYNDFLDVAEKQIYLMALTGVIQIATFHPHYQFADTSPDDVENYTNRSPYPMLHLLREDSITALQIDPDELAAIPERNIETMRRLGLEGIKALGQP